MKENGQNMIKRLFLFIMVLVLLVSYTTIAFAQGESAVSDIEALEVTTTLPEEAEFEDEEVPLSSVPGVVDGTDGMTPFGVLSAIGSYSLLIPALLLAAVALIVAAIFRKKEKTETAKQ